MADWKIIEQLVEIQERQNEIYSRLVEIGGGLPTEATQTTPEEPVTDIARIRLAIERLTKTSQETLELVRRIREHF